MTMIGLIFNSIVLGILLIIFLWMLLLVILRLIHRFCPSALPFLPLALTLIAVKAVTSLL